MEDKTPSYVLDSFALLAHLQDEPGAAQVARLLESAKAQRARLWMCIINFAEAMYITERERGLEKTKDTIAAVDTLPIRFVDVHRALALSAAHIKAHRALAFADAFAVALAQEKHATIVTGDPEFKTVSDQVLIEWLKRA